MCIFVETNLIRIMTNFNRRRSVINTFIVFNLLFTLVAISAILYFGYWLYSNPETVGEFFGRIANVFNSAK